MPTDHNLFDRIVTTDDLLRETGDRAWIRALLDAEAALARAEAGCGLFGDDVAAAIGRACAEEMDVDAIALASRAGGNPVIPLVDALREAAGPSAGEWVHWGATSQDVLDTASALVARRAGELIAGHLGALATTCAALAHGHRDTLMVGRTLLQPALPITFGLKAAGWLVAVLEAGLMLDQALSSLPAQLGGAAGTLASLEGAGPAVAAAFAAELELPEAVLPWHADRTPMVRLASALGVAAGTAARISGDVARLMQQEVGEAFEPAAPGRGGSSTLPHKRNPVGAAAVGAAARRVAALVGLYFTTLDGEHERSLSSWPVEWQTLGELLALAGGAVARTAETLEGLVVEAGAMASRVEELAGLLMTERVSLALAPQLGRAEAKRVVADAAAGAANPGARALADALAADPRVGDALAPGALAGLLRPDGYLGSTPVWIDRALALYRQAEAGP